MKTLTEYINESAWRKMLKIKTSDYFKKTFNIKSYYDLNKIINVEDPYFEIRFASNDTYWSLINIKNRSNTKELIKSVIDTISSNWDETIIVQRTNETVDGPAGIDEAVCDLLMLGKNSQVQLKYIN